MNKKIIILILSIGLFPLLINGYINSYICHNEVLYWGFELFSWVFVPYILFFILTHKYNLRWKEIGISFDIFGRKSIPLILFVSFFVSLVDYVFYKELYTFFVNILPSNALFNYQTMIPQDELLKIIVLIYFSVSAGVVEELYRGLVYKLSTLYANPYVFFLALSPIIFTLPHWETGIANLVAVYCFGLISASLFLVFRNLWPLIIGHIFTDLIWFS